jgi:hypothetical protein
MKYQRYHTGDRVLPVGKRAVRVVVEVCRVAGGYEYVLIGPGGQKERVWEHNLTQPN